MKVKRILSFTEDEVKVLQEAGHILGAVAKVFSEETPDDIELDGSSSDLAVALKDVIERVVH